MKSLLLSLFLVAVSGTTVHAASTDTVTESTDTTRTMEQIDADLKVVDAKIALLQEAVVPVEQKVVEIHMMSAASLMLEEGKKRRRTEKLPFLRAGTCSGSFVTDSGDILTAKHCVDGFDMFEVQTFDRRKYSAVVIATSTNHDLALLHIDRRDTPYFELAAKVERGQTVYILGSPLGITDTLSTGVVARIDGDITLLDCSALPGNSGGPVYDSNQELVGVLNAGYIVMYGVTHLNMAQGIDAVHFFLKKALEKQDGR